MCCELHSGSCASAPASVLHCTLRVYLRDTTVRKASPSTSHNPGRALITPALLPRFFSWSVCLSSSVWYPSAVAPLRFPSPGRQPIPHWRTKLRGLQILLTWMVRHLPVGLSSTLASALWSYHWSFLCCSAAPAYGSLLVPHAFPWLPSPFP